MKCMYGVMYDNFPQFFELLTPGHFWNLKQRLLWFFQGLNKRVSEVASLFLSLSVCVCVCVCVCVVCACVCRCVCVCVWCVCVCVHVSVGMCVHVSVGICVCGVCVCL